MKTLIRRIAITGPECTGKSNLAEDLAWHYKTVWVPEFARFYIDRLDRPYHYDDILAIAKEQFYQADKMASLANHLLFCDTELIVTKIWCEYKYSKCHPWILENIEKQNFDLFLLTKPDISWQPDPQREHPDKREELFELYIRELEDFNFPYKIVSGLGDARMENAVRLIENNLF